MIDEGALENGIGIRATIAAWILIFTSNHHLLKPNRIQRVNLSVAFHFMPLIFSPQRFLPPLLASYSIHSVDTTQLQIFFKPRDLCHNAHSYIVAAIKCPFSA